MKKILLFCFCFGILFLSVPTVFAAEEVTGIAQLSGCTGLDCSACNVVHLANGGIKWLIGILFVVFALLLAISGVKLVTSGGNHHALDEAKSSFMNAIIGFLIILSAWLIVDTIMRALVGTDAHPGQLIDNGKAGGYLFWSEVTCQKQTEAGYKPFDQDKVEYINVPPPPANDPGGVPGTLPAAPSANKIVNYAQRMDAKQCQYSQGKRNNCSGNPGYTDCSELVHFAYLNAGCRSPGMNTGVINGNATAIGNHSTLRTGDLIVHRSGGKGHVVICMSNGCGTVIHASGRGAPDDQPATVAVSEQIKTSGGSYYYSLSGARVIRAASWCPTGAGPQ